MATLNNIVIWFGTGVIIISFIIALSLSKNSNNYMKGFFLCPLIALLVSINSIFGSIFFLYNQELCFLIQSFLFLFELLFWSFFFLKILKDKKDSMKIKILFSITLLISIYLIYFSNVDKRNLNIVALSVICKTIFCIFFYYDLFKNLSYRNILLEPVFWIVTGLIFYSCLSLPIYTLNSYIKLLLPVFASNIFSISNMLIIIMHLFFIKAYLCKIRLHKA